MVVLAALSLSVPAAQAAEAKPAAAAKPAVKKSSDAKSKTAKTKDAGKTPAPKPADAAAPAETLTPEELEIASRVHVGKIACELGAYLLIAADEAHPGFFNVTADKRTFYMHPVQSRTGAVRMEDGKHEAVFLQLRGKSMLMDQKAGRRMADECQSPEQTAFSAQMKDHPPPNFLLGESLQAPAQALPETPQETAPQALPETSQAVPPKDLPPLSEDAAAQTATPPSLPSSGEKNAESLP